MANINIKRYNGSSWEIHYPKTTIGQVINLSSQLSNMQIAIDGKALGTHTHSWSEVTGKPTFATVATSGSYNDLSNKPTIPTIPSVMTTTEGNAGTATTQRTINAANLKSIILNHSPAGARTPTTHQHNATDIIGGRFGLNRLPTGLAGTVLKGNDLNSPEWGTISWDEVIWKPTFATVATSGSYDDLSDKPNYVPTERKINGKTLGADISLIASDVGALASDGTAKNSNKLGGEIASYYQPASTAWSKVNLSFDVSGSTLTITAT